MPSNNLSSSLPQHIAIIMDGNGRWATLQGKKRTAGHQAGGKTLKKVVERVFQLKIPYLSLYVFSVDNWKREKEEVSFLMKLIKQFYKEEFPSLQKQGIRIVHSGVYPPLSSEIIMLLQKIEKETAHNEKGTLNLCLNYGGRVEIIEGIKKVLQDNIKPEELTPHLFSSYLFHPEIPDVDLLIRTSGELRISDFLLWRLAYAELYFTDVLWPDFNEETLDHALQTYQNRKRRFGGIKK